VIYDLTADEHPLLSEKAKAEMADNEEGFEAMVNIAEDLLGLRGTTALTGAVGDLVTSYIVRQINLMYAMGVDPVFIKAEHSTHTAQGRTYRDNVTVDPIALRGVTEILAVYFKKMKSAPPVRSLRS
jgi:hypothetical protein